MRWISSASLLIAGLLGCTAVGVIAQNTAPLTTPAVPNTPTPEKPILIMIDAAHGGSDPGAILTPSVPEKDVTLNIARRLKQELSARGILCELVRDGDITLSADQRASATNTESPGLYLSLHASSVGSGMRVFTAVMPLGGDSRGPFLDWDTAQTAVLERSRTIEAQLVAAVQKTRFPTRSLIAPLRPLNNIKTPAIAIEISPTTSDVAQVASVGYQQMICAALANAISTIIPALRAYAGMHP